MRRRVLPLVTAVLVASTLFAAPAHAGNGQQCNRGGDRDAIRCCAKKADSQQQRNKCIQHNLD
jgi:hypothetical protein